MFNFPASASAITERESVQRERQTEIFKARILTPAKAIADLYIVL